MFSQLGPLFKTAFRKAEQSDARLEIRREEKEHQKKKEEEKEEVLSDDDLWNDTTIVSLQALRTFLIDFLKSKGDQLTEEEINTPSVFSSLTPTAPPPADALNARAHKAYAAMSAYAAPVSGPSTTPENKPETKNLSDLLAVDELRTMHILIRELDGLAAKGVQTLTIEKDETFLKALVQAVDKLRSAA